MFNIFLETSKLWVVSILFIIAVFTSLYSLKTEYRGKKLLILRIVIYLLIMIIILAPYREIRKSLYEKPIVAILIDASKSMTIRDPISRFSLVKEFLKSEFVNKKLKKKHTLLYYPFTTYSQKAAVEQIFESDNLEGNGTDIAQAILTVNQELKGKNVAGFIVVSDGSHNGKENPLKVVKNFDRPIYTFGVGKGEDFVDVSLAEIDHPEFAFKNTPIRIGVSIKAYGMKNRNISLILKKGEKIIQTKNIKIKSNVHIDNIDIAFKSEEVGDFTYTLEIPTYANEISRENNRKKFSIQILREKIRILLISGRPNWEYLFLRRAVKSSPNIEVVSFIILRGPEDIVLFPEDEHSLIPFPAGEIFTKEIFNFDILIFDNFSYRSFFPGNYLANIKRFVEENGGAFIMIGGDKSFSMGGYKSTPIEEILPVELIGQNERIDRGKFDIDIKDYSHPIINLEGDIEENKKIWNEMPKLEGINTLGRIKNGCIVLGMHPYLKNESGNLPVLAVWDKGKGRVMAIASNTTWRWSFLMSGMGRGSYYYNRFWQKSIRWLIKAPEFKLVNLQSDKRTYIVGDEIRLKVTILNEHYQPYANSKVYLWVTLPSNQKVRLGEGIPEENLPGKFIYSYKLIEEGDYIFTAEGDYSGRTIGKDTLLCQVIVPTVEFEDIRMNEGLLKGIADNTGGKYFRIGEITDKDINFPETDYTPEIGRERISLWNNIVFFVIVVMVLSGEWYLRRRRGLL